MFAKRKICGCEVKNEGKGADDIEINFSSGQKTYMYSEAPIITKKITFSPFSLTPPHYAAQ